MRDFSSFSEVIDAFGGVVKYRVAIDVPDVNARQMRARDSIPERYWLRTVHEAQVREIPGVTLELFARLAQDKHRKAVKPKIENVA